MSARVRQGRSGSASIALDNAMSLNVESEADEDEDEEDELDEEDVEETPMPNRIRQYSNQPGEVSVMNPSITEDEDEDAEEVDDLL